MGQKEGIEQNSSSNFPRILDKISIKINGFIKFITPSFGAALTFPLIVFNGLTTVNGAGIILPAAIGYPLASMLSIIYFILLVSVKVKRKHPFRTSSLIAILFLASLYTSFFSIYKEISDESLLAQSEEKALKQHNQFLLKLSDYIGDEINKIGNFAELSVSLDKEIKQLDEQYKFLIAEAGKAMRNNDRAIAYDLRMQAKKVLKEIEAKKIKIKAAKSNINYKSSQKLLEIQSDVNKSREEFEKNQNNFLGEEKQDNSLKDLVSINIEEEINSSSISTIVSNIFHLIFSQKDGEDSEELYSYYQSNDSLYNQFININSDDFHGLYNHLEPKRDDYRRTPYFLVPIELSIGGTRQLTFSMFALIVALTFELIPLLLGGINLSYEDQNTSKEEQNKIDIIYEKLLLILVSVGLVREEDKQEFLLFFYSQIDHDKKTISLSSFMTDNLSRFISKNYQKLDTISSKLDSIEKINNTYFMAASLFIDIMSNDMFKLLEQDSEILSKDSDNESNDNKITQYETDSSQKSSINFLSSSGFHSLLKSEDRIKTWRFVNKASYQIFLRSWIKAMMNSERIESYIDLIIDFNDNDISRMTQRQLFRNI